MRREMVWARKNRNRKGLASIMAGQLYLRPFLHRYNGVCLWKRPGNRIPSIKSMAF